LIRHYQTNQHPGGRYIVSERIGLNGYPE